MAIDTNYVQSMATQLAQYDVQAMLSKANRLETSYSKKLSAVNELDSALKKFQTSVKSLKSLGTNSAVLVNKAAFSSPDYATATVSSKAVAGSYDFFVQQLASRHQLSLENITDADVGSTGTITIGQGDKSFTIDLSTIDKDSSGDTTLAELAAAINSASDNTGVKATLVRSEGNVSLVLGSDKTGEDNAITMSSSGASSALMTSINSPRELSAAKNAIVRLGGEDGMELRSNSNTFENIIDGVSMTFTKAHQVGDDPVNISIEQDKTASLSQVQKLVDGFNALLNTFGSLTAVGSNSADRGILAGDASVRAIKTMLNQALRADYGGVNLIEFGISADSKGNLTVDATRFNNMLAESPDLLDKLFSEKGSLIDTLEKNIAVYTSSSTGLLKSRKDTINESLKKVNADFDKIQTKYDSYYTRYLKQYTSMMQIMNSMENTFGMF